MSKNKEEISVEYHYFVCQNCGFIGGNKDFSFIENDDGEDYDIDFHCPKCGKSNIKQHIGITNVAKEPLIEVEKILHKIYQEDKE
jgi:predicted RNA-binding Zn-ribbon protein involved in translation (DUF1610 family)